MPVLQVALWLALIDQAVQLTMLPDSVQQASSPRALSTTATQLVVKHQAVADELKIWSGAELL